jgi:hypothetical protein
LLALLGAHHIFHISRIRVNMDSKKKVGGAVDWLDQAHDKDDYGLL